MIKSLAVIVPAFNEGDGLAAILPELIKKTKEFGWKIIVVNDGSTDNTAKICEKFEPEVKLINHRHNHGYGAAIKSGIRIATTEWIATFDADGEHSVEDLVSLANNVEDFDAVIGMRTKNPHYSLLRRPGKFILKHICNIITGEKIYDINCGLRIIKRKAVLKIFGLTSDKFSFSTTSTISLINMGYDIKFHKITGGKRIGKSTVKPIQDGFETILLALRLATLFNPIRIFLPLALFLIFTGVTYQIFEFFTRGLTIEKSAILLIISGLICFFFALQQDQISSLRREIANFEADFENENENK